MLSKECKEAAVLTCFQASHEANELACSFFQMQ